MSGTEVIKMAFLSGLAIFGVGVLISLALATLVYLLYMLWQILKQN
jgi:hypothetical protein